MIAVLSPCSSEWVGTGNCISLGVLFLGGGYMANKCASDSHQQAAAPSARSTPQKTCTPATKSTPSSEKRPQKAFTQAAAESQKKRQTPATNSTPDSVTPPQKPSRQPAAAPTESPSSQSALRGSLETDAVSRGPHFAPAHGKPQLRSRPTASSPAGPPAKKTVGGPGKVERRLSVNQA